MDEVAQQRCMQASQLRDAGRLVEAAELFDSVFRSATDPVDRACAAAGLTDCLWKRRRKEDATEILRKVIEMLPEDNLARLDLEFVDAWWYWEQGKFQEAGQILERLALESRAHLDSPEGRQLYGDAEVKRGILRGRETQPTVDVGIQAC